MIRLRLPGSLHDFKIAAFEKPLLHYILKNYEYKYCLHATIYMGYSSENLERVLGINYCQGNYVHAQDSNACKLLLEFKFKYARLFKRRCMLLLFDILRVIVVSKHKFFPTTKDI